jgi:hypothetical protein
MDGVCLNRRRGTEHDFDCGPSTIQGSSNAALALAIQSHRQKKVGQKKVSGTFLWSFGGIDKTERKMVPDTFFWPGLERLRETPVCPNPHLQSMSIDFQPGLPVGPAPATLSHG